MTTGSPRQVSPEEFEQLVKLAQGHDAARRFAESELAYRKIIEIRPDLAEAHNNLGNALKDQGRLEEAKAAYQQAVALKPSLLPAHNNLGNIFKAQGQFEAATASYERVLAQNPQLWPAWRSTATWPCSSAIRGCLQRAAAHYEQSRWPSSQITWSGSIVLRQISSERWASSIGAVVRSMRDAAGAGAKLPRRTQ